MSSDLEEELRISRANSRAGWTALRMIREVLTEIAPTGSLLSGEQTINQPGPEPVHEAAALIRAILALRDERDAIVAGK